MKANYKKLFLWSSLGSIAVGAAIALTRRPKRVPYTPLACRKIPPDCQGVHLWTERFELREGENRRFVHDHYFLQPSRFKVWSVLDLSFKDSAARSAPEGAAIFHITQTRIVENSDGDGKEEYVLDRFYGIVMTVDAVDGTSCCVNSIARGGMLSIRKCYVGGASNGVESGEIHRSTGRILNYRIEMPQN
jgi:hypothetical protein